MRALIVLVTEKDVLTVGNDGDDGEYRYSDDDAGKQRYKLVGPIGRRKRVVKTGEDEDEEEEKEADGDGADDGDANAEEVEKENVKGKNGDTKDGRDNLDMAEFWNETGSDEDLEGSDLDEMEIEEAAEKEMEQE